MKNYYCLKNENKNCLKSNFKTTEFESITSLKTK